jgi:maltose-binding protein MalE
MEINLKDKCAKQTITRDDGSTIARMITDAWDKEEKIVIDFSNILIASVSFLDEAFGKLAFDHPNMIRLF